MTEAATGAPLSALPEAGVGGLEGASASAPAGGTGGTTSSFGNFLESPYGKLATKMLTSGGGKSKKGEGGEEEGGGGMLQQGIGRLSNASNQEGKRQSSQVAQALIASGMDPALANAIAGGQ